MLALAAAVGGAGSLAWWMQPAPHVALPATPPDDDLQMVAALIEAGEPRDRPRDLLVAGSGELVLARASDNSLVATPARGGAARTVARLDGPAWGMALADGALWLSTTRAQDAGARGAVVKAPLAGGALRVIADGLVRPRALASDGRWVFVVDVDASEGGLLQKSVLLRLPVDGGSSSVVARCESEVTGIALDETNAYWADRFEGTIASVPKAGGEPRALATERGLPEQLVVHGDALYWVERRSETVWTMPKAGGAPRTIAQDFAGFASLVVDARGVWWSSEQAIEGRFRVLTAPRSGGESSLASETVGPIDALASDGAHLYWARGGEVSRVETSAAERGQQHARQDE